jgi:hypothetical protein
MKMKFKNLFIKNKTDTKTKDKDEYDGDVAELTASSSSSSTRLGGSRILPFPHNHPRSSLTNTATPPGFSSGGDGTTRGPKEEKEDKWEDDYYHVEKQEYPPRPFLSYEVFMWVTFTTLTVLAIIDRFAWNVWPRQVFSIGAGNAGSDRMVGFKPGPWSVVLYDAVARISGRYSILCYNFLLLTRLEMLEDFLGPSSFIAKNILDCSNMINANLRLHKITGIGLCVLTLLHVWSILFPCIFHGYSATVVPGTFEWPLSERTPVKCSVEDVPGCWPGDANPDLKQMGLQVDDVFRMVEMTIFLAVLLPISVKWMASRWHVAIHLHRFINIIYFVDIVRRHSHPHSWVLNTPMFVLYVIDKWLYSNYWHRNDTPLVKKVNLGNDYMILYWKSPFGIADTIGPDYSLRLNESSFLESKHVFTCFQNRAKNSSQDPDSTGTSDSPNLFEWTVGVVIRVFRHPRVPKLGSIDSVSHTKRIYETKSPQMLITGPRQGEMSEQLKFSILAALKNKKSASPLVVFGTGSAINFIIDMLSSGVSSSFPMKTTIVYSTRDPHLFEWVVKAVSSGLSLLLQNNDNNLDDDQALSATLAFTGSTKGDDEESSVGWFSNIEETSKKLMKGKQNLSLIRKRLDLDLSIAEGSTVFCQGSAGLKHAVQAVSKKKGATFYGGRGGAKEDQLKVLKVKA